MSMSIPTVHPRCRGVHPLARALLVCATVLSTGWAQAAAPEFAACPYKPEELSTLLGIQFKPGQAEVDHMGVRSCVYSAASAAPTQPPIQLEVVSLKSAAGDDDNPMSLQPIQWTPVPKDPDQAVLGAAMPGAQMPPLTALRYQRQGWAVQIKVHGLVAKDAQVWGKQLVKLKRLPA